MRGRDVVVAGALVLAGCQFDSGIDMDRGWFMAAIHGTVLVDYEGTGEFYAGRDPRLGATTTALTVTSEGTGVFTGQELMLWGFVAIGEVGRYAVEASEDSAREHTFTAVYIRKVGGMYEAYTSVAGEAEITLSTEERVEGNVRFTGIRYCAVPANGTPAPQGSCDPRILDPGAPSIEVSGSFQAVPDTYEDVINLQTVPGQTR